MVSLKNDHLIEENKKNKIYIVTSHVRKDQILKIWHFHQQLQTVI